ncbi:MAG TPA: DUF2145 domain-containing protein [Telluria sp.]|nr:DUF2145 domain-containing protein [Telluria sp.]
MALAVVLACGGAHAQSGVPASSSFCDRAQSLSAGQQDKLLRFAAIVREELGQAEGDAALVSRSGLDLSRFNIRYSHTAVAWRDGDGAWSARQLYYACDERRPRIFDQGLAGFAMGIDDPSLGYVAIVRLPGDAADALRRAALDKPRALHLLAAEYSANAYPFSLRYQNCNQWVMELLAMAWGDLADGDELRARAQDWLRGADYAPAPIAVGSRLLMLAPAFTPFLHLDDHPQADRDAMLLQVSLPSTVEDFVHARLPGSERVELCHDGRQVVVHRGWTPIADGCKPVDGDRVIPLD